jgi:hypothetical protein
MFIPPVKARAPSTTRIFLCVRRFRYAAARPHRVEARRGQPHEVAKDRHVGVLLADAVDQYADLDAARLRGVERVGEAAADVVSVEYVGTQTNRPPRGFDRLEHARVRALAVFERDDGVAFGQRPPGDAVAIRREVGQRRVRVVRRARVGGERRRHGREPAHAATAAPDAVHAEHPIRGDAEERQQQDRKQPRELRARVALVEERVRRRRDHQHGEHGAERQRDDPTDHGRAAAIRRYV